MELTQDILIKAMKKAVDVGIFPDVPVDLETYVNNWNRMKAVLVHVLNEVEYGHKNCGCEQCDGAG
jgi:hypothetical protein